MRRTLLPLAVFFLLVLGTGTAQAATVTIEAQDNKFEPATATANVGDTIEFKNTGAAPHNAVADNGAFNIPLINPGETKTATVDQPGPIPYVCTFHVSLGMKGTLTVEGAAGAPAAGAPAQEPGQEGETNAPTQQQEAEGNQEASDPEGGEEGGDSGQEQGDQEGGGEEGGDEAAAETDATAAPEEPAVGPAFMVLSALIAMMVLLGMVPAAKTYLVPALKAAGNAPAQPVGPPPSIQALTAAAPAAAVAAPPAPATAPPAAAPAPVAAPTPAAPPPGRASPVEPTEPPLDPEQVYQAVLHDEQTKGTDPRVAEARAKAARMRAEEALVTPSPAAATAPVAAAPPAAAEAAAAPAAPAAASPEAPAAAAPAAAPPAEGVSAEEAADIRKKVYDEELAKGSDARVAEARAKAAEMRAKKGTSLTK